MSSVPGDPTDLGDLVLYAGDSYTIVLRILGEDRSTDSYTAQVRRRPNDAAVLRSFDMAVSTAQNETDPAKVDTLIALILSGDSLGQQDGLSRLGVRDAYFDVQAYRGGRADKTIARGHLVQSMDVSR